MADPVEWTPVLDDLEHRVSAAEQGDLAVLEGWTPPSTAAAMTPADVERATRVLGRQRALLARLREEQGRVAVRMAAARKPAFKAFTAPPVYVDRSL
ncbi:MAG TPA: hypothetical protein VIG76_14600 [Amnibacterium sp.]|uniref:hypothetical protein n=1 Tax=Amnibacterium sp. TaxID=1872496 RepID=UPI002F93E389